MQLEYNIEHPADAVYALLTDKQFICERTEGIGEDAPEVEISSEGDKVVIAQQRAARAKLPKIALKVVGEVQRYSMDETWQPDGDGWSGSYMMKLEGVPGTVAAEMALKPAEGGCVYSVVATPKVDLPLVGKALEKVLAHRVEETTDSEIEYLLKTLG